MRKSRDVWDVRIRLERDAQGNLSGSFAATKFLTRETGSLS